MKNIERAAHDPRYRLGEEDKLLPCPFCGGTELELLNTHTPAYWIECDCSAQIGGDYGPDLLPDDPYGSDAQHRASAESAIDKWNERE